MTLVPEHVSGGTHVRSTFVRAAGLLLAIASTIVTVHSTYVLWSRGANYRVRAEQLSTGAARDIRASEVLDSRFYAPANESGAALATAAATGKPILMLFTRNGCPNCDQSVDIWTRWLAGNTGGASSLDVRVAAYDDASGIDALVTRLHSSPVPLRVLKITDPLMFAVSTGIERLPLAILVNGERVSCVIEGVATDSAIGRCLGTIGQRDSLVVEHIQPSEPLPQGLSQ